MGTAPHPAEPAIIMVFTLPSSEKKTKQQNNPIVTKCADSAKPFFFLFSSLLQEQHTCIHMHAHACTRCTLLGHSCFLSGLALSSPQGEREIPDPLLMSHATTNPTTWSGQRQQMHSLRRAHPILVSALKKARLGSERLLQVVAIWLTTTCKHSWSDKGFCGRHRFTTGKARGLFLVPSCRAAFGVEIS